MSRAWSQTETQKSFFGPILGSTAKNRGWIRRPNSKSLNSMGTLWNTDRLRPRFAWKVAIDQCIFNGILSFDVGLLIIIKLPIYNFNESISTQWNKLVLRDWMISIIQKSKSIETHLSNFFHQSTVDHLTNFLLPVRCQIVIDKYFWQEHSWHFLLWTQW